MFDTFDVQTKKQWIFEKSENKNKNKNFNFWNKQTIGIVNKQLIGIQNPLISTDFENQFLETFSKLSKYQLSIQNKQNLFLAFFLIDLKAHFFDRKMPLLSIFCISFKYFSLWIKLFYQIPFPKEL